MPTLLSINSEEAAAKLSLARRYHSEILLIILFFCIGYLFIGQTRLTDRMQSYLDTDRREAINRIMENTEVIKGTTSNQKEIISILKENQSYLQSFKPVKP